MNKVTCALVLLTPSNKTLIVHPSGSHHFLWSFPKGIKEEGESEAEAAVRETFEETGYDVRDKVDLLFDLGRYEYTVEKDIHFFCLRVDEEIDPKTLHCSTYFSIDGKNTIPEVDNYRLLDVYQVDKMLSRRMKETFKQILSLGFVPGT